VLERIVAYSRKYEASVRVHLVDPCSRGPEQYDTGQPDYLLLNIVCGQVSMFPDVASVGDCPPTTGPSLYEWVSERGLLIGDDRMTVGAHGRPIESDDFLPRRLLGEYLVWFQELLIDQAPTCLEVVEHQAIATDLTTVDGGLVVRLSDETSIEADYLFLTVGQIHEPASEPTATQAPHVTARRIAHPYPLPDQLESIGTGETIAIAGLGLSAVDAILSLTIGRGGQMERRDGVDCYVPSGREPRIVAFSRSGLPYRSRPSLGAPLTYKPIVFTPESIDALRADRAPKLDFDRDVLPLLFTELRVAYWRAKVGQDRGWNAAETLLNEFRDAFVEGRLESYLTSREYNDASFDPQREYFGALPPGRAGLNVLRDTDSYQNWFRRWLDDDLRQARLGVSRSPLKAALEGCREFRDVIRYAVDFGGLTDESADRFFSLHAETINRIVVGPQKERTADILALIRVGLLGVSLGPNPRVKWDHSRRQWTLSSSSLDVQHDEFADWLYLGITNRLQTLSDDSCIVGAMARQGYLRRFRPSSSVIHAVDVDRSFHPISIDGVANDRIWVLGLLCDGVTFYNGYITSPGKFIRSQYDADRAVAQIFFLIDAERR
jgi:FAD-NAD(P)-binding protein